MDRTTMGATAALLMLWAVPGVVTAADESPAPSAAAIESPAAEPVQQVVAPAVGLTMRFPAEWRVSQPEGIRQSELTTPEGEPIYVTTAILANGGGGRWCDVDVYLDMIAPLEQHAYAYAAYLQRTLGNVPMVVTEAALPVGPSYRIEAFDEERGRLRSMFLFDGPAGEDGSSDRFVLTCATPPDSEPIGLAIAGSAALSEPVPPEALPEAAEEDETAG